VVDPSAIANAASAVDALLDATAPHSRCLHRALALGFLLRREGPILQIGVSRSGERTTAHAWLEIGGERLDESSPPGLAFVRLQATARR
jgi:hypothetical protein